jgi:hypothetical protein
LGVEQAMAGHLIGTRPVRLDIVVKQFAIAGAVQRVLVGGGRGMMADANLVDARTGALIISHPDLLASLYAGQGIAGTIVQAAIDSAATKSVAQQVADQYGKNYRDWLVRRTRDVQSAFALAIRAWPMLETARTGGDALVPAGV